METSLERLYKLLETPEGENLEFKEAKKQFDIQRLVDYCVALANEKGGELILGVSNQGNVVGTKTFGNLQRTKQRILDILRLRVEVEEIQHPEGRVLVFTVPPRPPRHANSTRREVFDAVEW